MFLFSLYLSVHGLWSIGSGDRKSLGSELAGRQVFFVVVQSALYAMRWWLATIKRSIKKYWFLFSSIGSQLQKYIIVSVAIAPSISHCICDGNKVHSTKSAPLSTTMPFHWYWIESNVTDDDDDALIFITLTCYNFDLGPVWLRANTTGGIFSGGVWIGRTFSTIFLESSLGHDCKWRKTATCGIGEKSKQWVRMRQWKDERCTLYSVHSSRVASQNNIELSLCFCQFIKCAQEVTDVKRYIRYFD